MPDAPLDPQSLPCPRCEYDLRGQVEPRCPECGATFESLEQLLIASRRVYDLYERGLVLRKRCAVLVGSSMLFTAFMDDYLEHYRQSASYMIPCLVMLLLSSGYAVLTAGRALSSR